MRPTAGFGHYLRDMVYGALDGVITTMAVLAGAEGASLSMRVGLVLGMANLLGDGISMGASNYLGLRSEIEQAGGSVAAEAPWRHGLATLAAFVTVGSIPLTAFAVSAWSGARVFPVAAGLAAAALAAAGAVRASFVGKTALRSAVEMVSIGVLAGGAAYLVGRLASALAR
jgi:VIT1/CCC1 family predicted Fe2+/Mn2+ transporter